MSQDTGINIALLAETGERLPPRQKLLKAVSEAGIWNVNCSIIRPRQSERFMSDPKGANAPLAMREADIVFTLQRESLRILAEYLPPHIALVLFSESNGISSLKKYLTEEQGMRIKYLKRLDDKGPCVDIDAARDLFREVLNSPHE